MGLLEKLQALGYQLKLVQMVPKTKTTHQKIKTRSITLKELATQLKAKNIRTLAESLVELTIAYEKIFETAEVKRPSNGWTIERLRDLLQTEPYIKIDSISRQKAILEKLAVDNVLAEEIIKDALAKDRALDTFEEFVDKKMKDRFSARQMRLLEIEKQIGLLQQEQNRLQQENIDESSQFSDWQKRKQIYEKEILETVDFLMHCDEADLDKNSSKSSNTK